MKQSKSIDYFDRSTKKDNLISLNKIVT